MGLILDTSVLIASERRRETIPTMIAQLRASLGDVNVAISTITIVELTHGIHRARTEAERLRRQTFADDLCRDHLIYPVSIEIAQRAGRLGAEQAAKGFAIAFEDLVIGATALHYGLDMCTHNVKHFTLLPGLRVVTP